MAVGNTTQASMLISFKHSQETCMFPLSLVAEKVRREPLSTCSSGAQGRSLLKLLNSTRGAAVGLGHTTSTQSLISFTGKTERLWSSSVWDWGTGKCYDVLLTWGASCKLSVVGMRCKTLVGAMPVFMKSSWRSQDCISVIFFKIFTNTTDLGNAVRSSPILSEILEKQRRLTACPDH